MTSRVAGRRALVTGGSSGIGAATATMLRSRGASVAVGARRIERLDGDFVARLDLTDRDSTTSFVQNAAAALGGLDIVVNVAGLGLGLELFHETDEEETDRQVDVNLRAAMRVARLCLPHMIGSRGHIVNVGSFFGRVAPSNYTVYTATKFGLRGFTYALRQDLLGLGVGCTIIDPGMVDTESSLVLNRGDADAAAVAYQDVEPLTADDVAECIMWALERPAHVNIDEIVVMPLVQSGLRVHRSTD